MELTAFFCDPWDSYMSQLERESDEQERALELDADLEHEYQLGRAHLTSEGECPWPWYADKPYAVQKPEVIRR